jgi:hypothetical protein
VVHRLSKLYQQKICLSCNGSAVVESPRPKQMQARAVQRKRIGGKRMRPVDPDDLEINKIQRERLVENVPKLKNVRPVQSLDDKSVQELFDYYRMRWEKEHKGALVIRSMGEAYAHLRDVLRACQGDKLMVLSMLNNYFSKPNAYYKKMAHSLELFKRDVQQLASDVATAKASDTASLRVQIWTHCPWCENGFVTQCRATDVERVQDSVPCEKCKGQKT